MSVFSSIKRPSGTVEKEEEDRFFERICDIVKEENEAIDETLETRMVAIELRQQQ